MNKCWWYKHHVFSSVEHTLIVSVVSWRSRMFHLHVHLHSPQMVEKGFQRVKVSDKDDDVEDVKIVEPSHEEL